jgi:glycosyltransferase involved in cell wall biosynthesis
MKVILLCRLFSGLAGGLKQGEWQPQGVPAIAKLLEGLRRDADVTMHTVFAVTDRDLAPAFPHVVRSELAEIGSYEIWPWRRFGFRLLERIVNEAEHILRALVLIAARKPDVVYATFGLVNAAAAIVRLRLAPVVLRLMGIFPYHRKLTAQTRSLGRFALGSPFAHVVCTEEGSEPAAVLPKLIDPKVPMSIILNGVDVVSVASDNVATLKARHGLGEKPIVLFLGRLEEYKGCFEFLETAASFLRLHPGRADFVMVGDGPCRIELERRSRTAQIHDSFHLVGAVASADVPVWLKAADIYVSLNKHGNLSNANLEAVAMGCCVLIPGEDADRDTDRSTTRILPPDTVIRFDGKNVAPSLSALLARLIENPAEISRLKKASAGLAQRVFVSWQERVDKEIAIMRSAQKSTQ